MIKHAGENRKSSEEFWWVMPIVAIAIWNGMGKNSAIAQLIPDATLGTESSIVVPLDELSDRIDGGAIRGSNLFHSFGEFNIDVGRGAFFSNPAAIENILTRVTGGNPSNIFGTLGVLGDANLFLVNPSGIVFGPDARLDVGGSFFASTAEGILFPDGYEFSAANPDAPPLLTVNVPIGLQFGVNPGSIQVEGAGLNRSPAPDIETLQESIERDVRFQQNFFADSNGLRVEPERTLALVGGEITLFGGLLKAPAGRIELGSVAGETSLGLRATETAFALDYSGVQNFQDIQLSGEAAVFASGEGAGNIQIQGRNVTLTEGSEILTDTLGSEDGKTLTVRASEVLELSGQSSDGTSPTSLSADVFGIGSGAEILVEAGQLILREEAVLGTLAGREGDGGDVTIRASELVELSGSSSLGAATSGTGDSGNITIETGQFIVRDGASVVVGTSGPGNSGILTIDATELVELNSSGSLQAFTSNSGRGGDINISTLGSISIDGGFMLVRTLGEGQGGSLRVNASESIQLSAENSNLLVTTEGNGDAGEIRITTGELMVRNEALIRVGAVGEGRGQGGKLTVNASESIELIDSGRLAALTASAGDGGEVNVSTTELILRDGGRIVVGSTDEGRAGSLRINASEFVVLDGLSSSGDRSQLRASTVGPGDGGEIEITTGRLIVRDGALVAVSTSGEGDGGTLTVNASESVELEGLNEAARLNSLLTARTSGTGNGGAVTINTGQLIVRDGASVSVETSGRGRGGTLTVNASESVELLGTVFIGESSVADFGSNLSALTSDAGDGGEITITTGRLIVRDGASVLVGTLDEGNGGKLTVNASESVELRGISSGGNSSNLGVITSGTGNAGEIEIDTGRLIVRDGASILVGTIQESQGNGGRLTINASESVEVSGTSILNVDDLPAEVVEQVGLEPGSTFELRSFLSAGSDGNGDGGEVNITTERLMVRDGALISATTMGEGRGGRLTIAASESVELSGFSTSGESTNTLETSTFSSGEAGDINISTRQLIIQDGGDISVSTLAQGSGGTISINATESIELSGTAPDGSLRGFLAFTRGAGNAGNIFVETGQLRVADGAGISVSSRLPTPDELQALQEAGIEISGNLGNPGSIEITADDLRLENEGLLNATSATGRGGNIEVRSPDIRLRDRSLITASGSDSNPTLEGNIDLSAETLVLLDNSQIVTSSDDPQGGSNIAIRPLDGESVAVLVSPDSLINAQGELIVEGEIEPDPAEVPEVETTDVTSLISQGCQDYEGSEFYITGRGGLPPNPRDILPGSSLVELDWVEDEPESAVESSQRRDRPFIQTSTEHPPLIEAQGWYTNEMGQVVLTANPISATPHSSEIAAVDCHTVEEVRSHRERSN